MFLGWVLFLSWSLLQGCYDLPLRRTLVRSVILFIFALMRESYRDACLHASLPGYIIFSVRGDPE